MRALAPEIRRRALLLGGWAVLAGGAGRGIHLEQEEAEGIRTEIVSLEAEIASAATVTASTEPHAA